MPSTVSAGSPCLQPGWNPAIPPSPCSIWAKIPFIAAVSRGDSLGPLGFSLTLQPLIKHLQADIPGLRLNLWYLDDTLMGSPADLAALYILWSAKVLHWASTSTAPNLSSTSLRTSTRLCLPYRLTSPPPAVALLFWVVLLDHQTTARKFLAPGCRR